MRVPIEISVQEASEAMEKDQGAFVLVDCRRDDELAIVRVDGAVHIPMEQMAQRVDEVRGLFERGAEHVGVLCHHGRRSMKVTEFLRGQGMESVSSVAGGIDAWAVEVEPGMKRY